MLITEKVKLKSNNRINSHYLKLGYNLDNDYFFIDVKDLSKTSRIEVKAKCDYCMKIREIPFYLYLKNVSYNNKFACSSKCGSEKRKEISMVKYGVDTLI